MTGTPKNSARKKIQADVNEKQNRNCIDEEVCEVKKEIYSC